MKLKPMGLLALNERMAYLGGVCMVQESWAHEGTVSDA